MKKYEKVITEEKGHIGIVTFNRPEKMNVFNLELGVDTFDALMEMEENKEIRVVVIKGAGKHFSAGIDVKEILEGSPTEREYLLDKTWGLANLLVSGMKKPVIASVQGYATAIGCGLVAAADLAIASEDAHFAANAIDVGIFCTGPGKFLDLGLPRKKALEMIYMGKIIDAQEALRFGLVNDVVPNEKLTEATMAMADILARKSPLALQAGKSSFYKAADMSTPNALAYLKSTILSMSSTEDAQEGMSAFLEKRKQREWKMK